jgi:hypothetical protein
MSLPMNLTAVKGGISAPLARLTLISNPFNVTVCVGGIKLVQSLTKRDSAGIKAFT